MCVHVCVRVCVRLWKREKLFEQTDGLDKYRWDDVTSQQYLYVPYQFLSSRISVPTVEIKDCIVMHSRYYGIVIDASVHH